MNDARSIIDAPQSITRDTQRIMRVSSWTVPDSEGLILTLTRYVDVGSLRAAGQRGPPVRASTACMILRGSFSVRASAHERRVYRGIRDDRQLWHWLRSSL